VQNQIKTIQHEQQLKRLLVKQIIMGPSYFKISGHENKSATKDR
jgi:hypothetical protein